MARLSAIVLVAMLAAAVPASAQRTEAEQSFVRWMTVAGAGAGVALDTFYFFTIHSEYPAEHPGAAAAIIASTSAIQLATAASAFWGMGELIVRLKPTWWQAGLTGPVYGALTGGISFGLVMGTAFAIGVPTGAISLNPDSAFWPASVNTWYEAFGRGFLGGASFGAIFGAMGGLAAAPTASVIYRRAVQ